MKLNWTPVSYGGSGPSEAFEARPDPVRCYSVEDRTGAGPAKPLEVLAYVSYDGLTARAELGWFATATGAQVVCQQHFDGVPRVVSPDISPCPHCGRETHYKECP